MKNIPEGTPYNFLHNSLGSIGKMGSLFSDFENHCSLFPNNAHVQHKKNKCDFSTLP